MRVVLLTLRRAYFDTAIAPLNQWTWAECVVGRVKVSYFLRRGSLQLFSRASHATILPLLKRILVLPAVRLLKHDIELVMLPCFL